MLSAVLDRDAEQYSATQTRDQALASADHLAILHAIWAAETTAASRQHYRGMLMGALPPGHRAEPGNQAQWLWRTLRGAEPRPEIPPSPRIPQHAMGHDADWEAAD